MYSWRITKYNPAKRNESGHYTDLDEWTCYSEVGKKLSMDEYLDYGQLVLKIPDGNEVLLITC